MLISLKQQRPEVTEIGDSFELFKLYGDLLNEKRLLLSFYILLQHRVWINSAADINHG